MDVESLKFNETKKITVVGKDLQNYDITLSATRVSGGIIYVTYNRQGKNNSLFVPDSLKDVLNHNELSGLQGGSVELNQYVHLTEEEYSFDYAADFNSKIDF